MSRNHVRARHSNGEHSDVSSRFLICNDGYTIERYIHGMDAAYNDIQPWKFKDLLDVFGADPDNSKTFQIRTKSELNQLLSDEEFAAAKYIQVRQDEVAPSRHRPLTQG